MTIRQVNLLHRHFLQEVYEPFRVPGDDPFASDVGMHLTYKGKVLTCDYRGSLVDESEEGSPLDRSFARFRSVIFEISVTTAKTKFTLAKCNIEGQDFYANVVFICDGHTVDDKIPELGNQSVRQSSPGSRSRYESRACHPRIGCGAFETDAAKKAKSAEKRCQEPLFPQTSVQKWLLTPSPDD